MAAAPALAKAALASSGSWETSSSGNTMPSLTPNLSTLVWLSLCNSCSRLFSFKTVRKHQSRLYQIKALWKTCVSVWVCKIPKSDTRTFFWNLLSHSVEMSHNNEFSLALILRDTWPLLLEIQKAPPLDVKGDWRRINYRAVLRKAFLCGGNLSLIRTNVEIRDNQIR